MHSIKISKCKINNVIFRKMKSTNQYFFVKGRPEMNIQKRVFTVSNVSKVKSLVPTIKRQ